MLYAICTTTRKIRIPGHTDRLRGECAVVAQLREMGINADAAMEVTLKRQGKRRYPDVIERPLLAGYVFADVPADMYASAIRLHGVYAARNATDGVEYGGYTATPGYEFRLSEGLDALEGSAAARGGLFSGNAMQSALQYGQDYASNEYSNYLNRLSGLASSGQNAAGMQGAAAQNYGANAGSALAAAGNASAAGAIGVGNALQGGIQNLVGWNGYQSAQNGTTGTLGTLFGGSWGIS
ncbi:hypothetical protein ACSSNL_18130 [Thalassobius sp. S69A]|uniref:hypothetical protein n=1 Tax=unclassified Thalassovita TaxID=2619711 RepID=UPI003C7CF6AD